MLSGTQHDSERRARVSEECEERLMYHILEISKDAGAAVDIVHLADRLPLTPGGWEFQLGAGVEVWTWDGAALRLYIAGKLIATLDTEQGFFRREEQQQPDTAGGD